MSLYHLTGSWHYETTSNTGWFVFIIIKIIINNLNIYNALKNVKQTHRHLLLQQLHNGGQNETLEEQVDNDFHHAIQMEVNSIDEDHMCEKSHHKSSQFLWQK